MVGNKYKLFGTTTIFEITDEDNGYWIIKVYVEDDVNNAVIDIRMTKQDLTDSVNIKQLNVI